MCFTLILINLVQDNRVKVRILKQQLHCTSAWTYIILDYSKQQLAFAGR